MSKRKPCLPPEADLTRQDGNCKWCNKPLPRKKDGGINRALFWHSECRDIAEPILMGGPQQARYCLEARDGRKCKSCGAVSPGVELDVDHETPLWSVDRDAPDAWKFWTLENLQLLCKSCHKAKTAREAKQRAKERRLRGETCNGPKRKIPAHQNPWPKGRKLRA